MKSVGEILLYRAYGVDVARREPCACGGTITASELDVASWPSSMMAHQRTDIHRRWQRLEDWRKWGRR